MPVAWLSKNRDAARVWPRATTTMIDGLVNAAKVRTLSTLALRMDRRSSTKFRLVFVERRSKRQK